MAHWKALLESKQRNWLVTGCAGFIGSHLVENLLNANQHVVGLDNFATGRQANLDNVAEIVGRRWGNFSFIEGDITDPQVTASACKNAEIVLHQAALGSVPRSIADPTATMAANVDGFLQVLEAARSNNVSRFVYASSSSVYGDSKALPKVEHAIGQPLSPYALSKSINEQLAQVWNSTYGMHCVGLRYFNVFGPRQDPDGPYAAVIPKWANAFSKGETPEIYGDGETTRDFCYVENAVQANVLAALVAEDRVQSKVFNVSFGQKTSLNTLYHMIGEAAVECGVIDSVPEAVYKDFRSGDIRDSLANLDAIQSELGYEPGASLQAGLKVALPYYLS